jgi:hypothetical protein
MYSSLNITGNGGMGNRRGEREYMGGSGLVAIYVVGIDRPLEAVGTIVGTIVGTSKKAPGKPGGL